MQQFESEGERGSGGWVPLSPAYAAWKAIHYPGQPMLQRTGRLIESFEGGPGAIRVVRPESLAFGSDIPYGTYHQTGTGRMPRRRIIDLTEEDRTMIMREIQRYLVRVARQNRKAAAVSEGTS